MSEKREKLPLLNTSTPPPNLFPLIQNYNGHPATASYYWVVEITPSVSDIHLETRERKLRQPGGIAGTPLVAIIALTVGLVLIVTLAGSPSTSASRSGNEVILKAAAPPQPSLAPAPRLSQSPGYVDIDIPQGRLRGYTKLSREGREYSAFYKVPYAAPPLGELRFKDPVAPSSWEGLRDIPVVGVQCIQREKYPAPDQTGSALAVGEEDCLYANVYTPSLPQSGESTTDSSSLLPVMVYIHGGGQEGNGSRYNPKYFMDEDVVIITFQYRLGPFGFLSTGDDVIRGNMGMKDQVQLLRWTKENVKYFNGNPDLVTIYGNNGGRMNVGHQLLSPLSAGLFHRAISQSGTSLCNAVPQAINQVAAKGTMEEVGKAMGCPTDDSQQYWECLRDKPAPDLAILREKAVVYSITIEDQEGVDASTKFMPDKPFNLLQSGQAHPVPYIAGNVNAEYYGQAILLLQDENATQFLNDQFEEVITSKLQADLSVEEKAKVKEFYFGTERIWNGSVKNLGNLISDRQMVHCAYLAARYHANTPGAQAWLYWITKPPAKSYLDKTLPGFPAKELGFVTHADELQFLFLYDGYPEIGKDDEEYAAFSKYFVKLWVHFARTGTGTMDGVEWTPVNGLDQGFANSTQWLELNDSPALTIGPQQRMGFWDGFSLKQLRYDV